MGPIRGWGTITGFVGRYFASQAGLATRPQVDAHIEGVTAAIGPLVGVPKRFAIVGGENIPLEGPLVVASNHAKLDDPLLVYHATRMATDNRRKLRIMMRDDFFAGPVFQNRFVNAVRFFECVGAYGISRDHITFAQMKPFLRELEQGGGFLIFPGRTRTRSGVFIEYREGVEEPGSVAFFLHQTQRRHRELRPAAVPAVRNYNPVNRRTCVAFGPPLYLPVDATREDLRPFDFALIEAMSACVELNVAQVVSVLVYLRCLHRLPATIDLAELTDMASVIFAQSPHALIDPAAESQIPEECSRTVEFLMRHKILRRRNDKVLLDVEAILAVPPPETKYRRVNPVKYLANQVLHLPRVIAACESVVLKDRNEPATQRLD